MLTSTKSAGEKAFDIANVAMLSFLMFITLYPFYYVLVASFSNGHLLLHESGLLWRPLGPTVAAFIKVFENPMILKGYRNTMFLLFVGVPFQILMSSIGAYFLSRNKVMLKKPIMLLIVFTMFFEGGLVPFYLLVISVGLHDTLWALVLPFAINTYYMIIMRTAFLGIPDSLEECAVLEGAGHYTILFRIVIPLSKATIAVMLLFYGVATWNAWFWASKFIHTRELYPLQVILREILILNTVSDVFLSESDIDQEAISESIKYATIVVTTVPILVIYPFIQRYFIGGVMIGALKG